MTDQDVPIDRPYHLRKFRWNLKIHHNFSRNEIWELDHKEGWMTKNWGFKTIVLEKTLVSPLDSKKIKPVDPKRNQPWLLTGRINAEAAILWPPDKKSQLIGKDSDARRNWWHEEKWVTKDEMLGWHHQLNGMNFSKLQEIVKNTDTWLVAVHGITESQTQLNDWRTTKTPHCTLHCVCFYN